MVRCLCSHCKRDFDNVKEQRQCKIPLIDKTLHDHLPDFQDYKLSKAQKAEFVEKLKISLKKSLSSLCVHCSKDGTVITNFITQEAAQLIYEYQGSEGFSSELKVVPKLPRSPVKCPVTACHQVFFSSEMCAHFLTNKCRPTEKNEINVDEQVKLEANFSLLKFNENYCLGFFAYGGSKTETQPESAVPNSFLNLSTPKYLNHLPVVLLACRTHLLAISGQHVEESDPKADIFVLWFVTVPTTDPIYAEVQVANTCGSQKRKITLKVRSVVDTQDVWDFIHEPGPLDSFVITRNEWRLLTDQETRLETIVSVKILEVDQ